SGSYSARLSGNEDERAADVAVAELRERLVRVLERERLDLRSHRDAWRELEELLAVAARQVGDRPQDALTPQELVGERRDVAHVDPGADHRPALRHRGPRRRHELAAGREDDRRA